MNKDEIAEFVHLCHLGSIFSIDILTEGQKDRIRELYKRIRQ